MNWTNSSDKYQKSSVYEDDNTKYKYNDSGVRYIDLEKVDTKSLPNNLFEMKQKQLEEQQKNQGYGKYDSISNSNRFASVSNDPNYRETMNFTADQVQDSQDDGMISTFGKVVGGAFERTKELAYGAKEKFTEYEVADKLKYSGQKTLGALKYTGETISSIAQSDTTKSILSKTGENIGYLFNRLFWGSKPETNENTSNTNQVSSDNLNTYDSGLINDNYNKSYSKYSPPRSNNLDGNITFSKEKDRYSSKSFMS